MPNPTSQPAEELISAPEPTSATAATVPITVARRRQAPSRTIGKATSSCCRPGRPSIRRGRSTRRPSTNLRIGREVRTGWDDDKNGYALGELAAEIASCYVAAELGIPQGEGLGNHAAYLKNWLEALKNDRNYIFKAAKQASKVTDFLLGFVRKPEPEAVGAMQ